MSEDDDQTLVAALLASTPPPDVPADFLARVNARIDETEGWFGVADFRLWTLRLAPAAAVLALITVLWPGTSSDDDGHHRRRRSRRTRSSPASRDRLATGRVVRRAARRGADREPAMPDSRPVWFASFTLVVFCLGGLAGDRVGGHLPPFGPGPGLFGGRGGPGGPGAFGRGAAVAVRARTRRSASAPAADLQRSHRRAAARRRAAGAGEEDPGRSPRSPRGRAPRRARAVRKEQSDLRAAIRAVLTPEQQARFDKFLDRRP